MAFFGRGHVDAEVVDRAFVAQFLQRAPGAFPSCTFISVTLLEGQYVEAADVEVELARVTSSSIAPREASSGGRRRQL